MQTKLGNRGQTLVRVQNVDTGVILWKEKDVYDRSRAQWTLAPDEELETAESVEDKIEDVMEEVEEILEEVKSKRRSTKKSNKKK